MAARNPSSPPTPTLTTWGPPRRPQSPLHPLGRELWGRGRGISRQVPPRKHPCGEVRRGGPSISARSGPSGLRAAARSRRGGQTPGPLTPITTVSSPLNLGMNLSPRRISASLRGRNRHITLMLHSAGSAISAGRREGARGGVGGPGVSKTREEAANSTARSEAASCSLRRSFSAGHGELCGWAALAAARLGRWAVYQHSAPRAADLPSLVLPRPCAAPRAHLPATTRPADEAMRAERASPGSDLPGSCALGHPASAPARSAASRARPSAPSPRPPLDRPGRKRHFGDPTWLRARSGLGLVVAPPAGRRVRMLGVGFGGQRLCPRCHLQEPAGLVWLPKSRKRLKVISNIPG